MLRARLRGREENLGQYHPTLVTGADSVVYLAWSSLLPGQVDPEPHDPTTPQSRLPGLLEEDDEGAVDVGNASALHRLEGPLGDYGLQNLTVGGTHTLALANPVGFRHVHDLRVFWLGATRQWLVLQGGVRWVDYDAQQHGVPEEGFVPPGTLRQMVYSTRKIHGGTGWIVLTVRITPRTNDDREGTGTHNGYRLTPLGIHLIGVPFNTPCFKMRSEGVWHRNGPGTADDVYWHRTDWGAGTYMLPIARVSPPGERGSPAPSIAQIARGSWDLWNGRLQWDGGLPRAAFTSLTPGEYPS
jgi:hypothetical protein